MSERNDSKIKLVIAATICLAIVCFIGVVKKNELHSKNKEIIVADEADTCTSTLPGDVDCDGVLTIKKDYKLIKKAKNRKKLQGQKKINGDVTGNGKVTSTDARWLQYIIKKAKKKKKLTITFKDTVDGEKKITVPAGERIGELPQPTTSISSEKYIVECNGNKIEFVKPSASTAFAGWYTCTKKTKFTSITAPYKSVTLYPIYVEGGGGGGVATSTPTMVTPIPIDPTVAPVVTPTPVDPTTTPAPAYKTTDEYCAYLAAINQGSQGSIDYKDFIENFPNDDDYYAM